MSNLQTKVCCTCRQEKQLSEFHNNKSRTDGKHISCKPCLLAFNKPKTKEQGCRDAKAYRERHPERVKNTFKKWYYSNKESILEAKREKDKTPARIANRKEWNLKNKAQVNEQRRARRKTMSPKQKAEKILRDRFYKVIKRMKKGVKIISAFELLGCTIDEFKTYLESLFIEGMCWDNHGNGEGKWNIDHIVPLVTFDLYNIEDQMKAFHYSNMRPLWFEKNMGRPRKHFKYE